MLVHRCMHGAKTNIYLQKIGHYIPGNSELTIDMPFKFNYIAIFTTKLLTIMQTFQSGTRLGHMSS